MNSSWKKPYILIIGHAQHGKDSVAEILAKHYDIKFKSSSLFIAEKIIWDQWGKERYASIDDMYQDRGSYRKVWKDLIAAWCTPEKTRTATTMHDEGYDLYVGMRDKSELKACKEKGIFNAIIWVNACNRKPYEDPSSMELSSNDADYIINNNSLFDLKDPDQHAAYEKNILNQFSQININLYQKGFKLSPKETKNELTWEDAPEGSSKLLDHGFINTLDVLGSDHSICNAARMSYGRGTKKVNNDEGLINYLVKNHHTSPLEMGALILHMRMPIFVMRQLVRHRTAKLNEYSGRYSEMVKLFYVPKLEHICSQDKVNKQGSAKPLREFTALISQNLIRNASNTAFSVYEDLLEKGVSRETARIVLPLNTYTEVTWQMDVSNLIKFLFLRDDSHAQYEIRVYAAAISQILKEHFPLVWNAYHKATQSEYLSPDQIDVLLNRKLITELPKGETKQIQDVIDKYKKDIKEWMK